MLHLLSKARLITDISAYVEQRQFGCKSKTRSDSIVDKQISKVSVFVLNATHENTPHESMTLCVQAVGEE